MKAIRYTKPGEFALVMLPVPQPKSSEVLVKGRSQLIIISRILNISQIVWHLRTGS